MQTFGLSGRIASRTLSLTLCGLSLTMLGACGGGDRSDSTSTTPAVAGIATYDFVPTATAADAKGGLRAWLDYPNTERRPVRHALVEAVSEDGSKVLGSDTTDDHGSYRIDVPAGTRAYVRVTAQASDGETETPGYLIQLRNNTAPAYAVAPPSAPLYSMRGDAFTVAQGRATEVDLNAGSGWTGDGYGASRTAAPFAVMDQMVSAALKMRTAEPSVALPPLNVFWSVDNRPAEGEESKGYISTSHYSPESLGADKKGLYILGAENVDTDEYDGSVLVHEFGHYVEANLSRSDNIGGTHAIGNALDMRVAFGEGFGNAFSSMIRDTPVYTDTNGPRQGQTGIAMRLDQVSPAGLPYWFDESAVGNFLYSAYKAPEIGFDNIYRTLLGGQKTTPAFTSVFSFATALRPMLSGEGKTKLDTLLAAIHVPSGNQLDEWATAMKIEPINPAVTPAYVVLAAGGSATSCTTTQFGAGNKLGNFGHVRLRIPAPGSYQLAVTQLPDGISADKFGLKVLAKGADLKPASATDTVAVFAFPSAGDYAADFWLAQNIDFSSTPASAPLCATLNLKAAS
jgi:hypothetical protein